MMRMIKIALATGLALIFSGMAAADGDKVPYPENYRNWTHVKTMLIQPGHPLEDPFQGIHHIYANDQARQGMESGNYTNGATLVFDLLNYVEEDNTIQEGSRKLTGVMYRDSEKYAKTGGWGFEAFAGDSKTDRIVKDGGTSCFSCHTPQEDSSFVYSRLRPAQK